LHSQLYDLTRFFVKLQSAFYGKGVIITIRLAKVKLSSIKTTPFNKNLPGLVFFTDFHFQFARIRNKLSHSNPYAFFLTKGTLLKS
jgi:hypothetical protein